MKSLLSAWLALFFLVVFVNPAEANCGAYDYWCFKNFDSSNDGFIHVRYYYLSSSSNYTFETSNLTAGGDTYIALVRLSTGSVVCENDDKNYGDLSSKITTGAGCSISSGDYALYIRSYFSEYSSGTCDIEVKQNGSLFDSEQGVSFGGYRWATSYSNQESFQSANLSRSGAVGLDTVIIVGDSSSFSDKIFDDDSGTTPSARAKTGNISSSDGYVRFGKTGLSNLEGTVIVFHNDIEEPIYSKPGIYCTNFKDYDCDGVGNKLEDALGTCKCIPGKDIGCPVVFGGNPFCAKTFNAKDTDGDGIPDSWEIFGRVVYGLGIPNPIVMYSEELSRYGADPKKKNIFIEIDHISSTQLSEDRIKRFIDAFDLIDSVTAKNPDGSSGINLHIDVKPASGTNFLGSVYKNSSYGDWGGSQTGISMLDPTAGREGIWRFGELLLGAGSSYVLSDRFEFSTNVSQNGIKPDNFLHELGHSLGLTHGGGIDSTFLYPCVANYVSTMNYGITSDIDFSNGNYLAINPTQLYELSGLKTPSNDPFQHYSQIAEYNTSLNNPNDFSYLIQLNTQMSNYGAIDWNRNGSYDTLPVKGYITPKNDTRCNSNGSGNLLIEHEFQNSLSVSALNPFSQRNINGGIKLIEYKQKLYSINLELIGTSRNIIVKRYDGGTSWVNIPTPNIPTSIKPDVDSTLDAVAIIVNGQERLYIVYKSNQNLYSFYANTPEQNDFTSPTQIVAGGVTSNPSIFKDGNSNFSVFFNIYTTLPTRTGLLLSGDYIHRISFDNGVWDSAPTPEQFLDPADSKMKYETSAFAPSVLSIGNDRWIFKVDVPLSGNSYSNLIRIYKYNHSSSEWEIKSNQSKQFFASSIPQSSFSYASKVAVLYDNRLNYEKTLHLWYIDANGELRRLVSTEYNSTNQTEFKFHISDFVSNEDCKGKLKGDPFLFFSSLSNKFYSAYHCDKGMIFLPNADGIPNIEINANNDHASIIKFLCYGVAKNSNGGGDICEYVQ